MEYIFWAWGLLALSWVIGFFYPDKEKTKNVKDTPKSKSLVEETL